MEPNRADFYHNRGFSSRKQNKLKEAINDFSIAIKLDHRHIKALSNRAFCYERKGDYELALKDYYECTNVDQNNINV